MDNRRDDGGTAAAKAVVREKCTSRELLGHKSKVYTVGWSCNGKKIASGSVDKTIKIWSADAPQSSSSRGHYERPEAEITSHKDHVVHLAWHPKDPNLLAGICNSRLDINVRMHDVRSRKEVMVVPTSSSNIYLAWHPDGNILAVSNRESQVQWVDVRKLKVVRKERMDSEVNEIAWGPTPQHLTLSSADGAMRIFNYPQMGAPIWCLQAHGSTCDCVSYGGGGGSGLNRAPRWMATGGADATLSLWDVQDLVCVKTWYHMDHPIRTLGFSHDGQHLAYAGDANALEVLKVPSGEVLFSLPTRSSVETVAWSPTQPALAYGFDDGLNSYGLTVLTLKQ